MKRNLIKGIFTVVLSSLIATSCTKDFDEINKDPNTAPVDLASPGFLLTNASESMTDLIVGVGLGHEMGSGWVQHMAKVQYTDEDRYIPRVSTINNVWSSFYSGSGNDVEALIAAARAQGDVRYQGVGYVLRAYILSVLTDLYGDIPYKEAWKSADGIYSPKFSTQEEVYRGIIAELDSANMKLDASAADITGDILYGGSVGKWKMFANSLRLRLLLRMSAKDASFVTTEMTKMINDPSTYPVFTSNDDQAALQYLGDAPNNHPLVENRKTRDDHRVSKTIVDYALNDYADWDSRIFAYAEPAEGSGSIAGLPNGLTSADASGYNGGGLTSTSTINEYFTTGTPVGMLMSYPELQLILAEAAHKGFIPGGDAEAEVYYTDGITASFEFWEEEIWQGIISVYGEDWRDPAIWGIDLSELLDWHLNTAWPWSDYEVQGKLDELIGLQRWSTMFDQGLQAWFEYRRTGYPALTPGPAAVLSEVPSRLTYPLDEYARNAVNVEAAASNIGGDKLTTKVWWAK
jgi:hypothetical protein